MWSCRLARGREAQSAGPAVSWRLEVCVVRPRWAQGAQPGGGRLGRESRRNLGEPIGGMRSRSVDDWAVCGVATEASVARPRGGLDYSNSRRQRCCRCAAAGWLSALGEGLPQAQPRIANE